MVVVGEDLRKKGNALYSEGKYAEAVKSYQECIEKSEGDKNLQEVAHRNLAQCYLKLGKYNNVVKSATKALEIMPNDTKALYRRSLAYESLGEIPNCLKDAKKLYLLEPSNSAVQELIRRVEACVIKKKDFAHSLKGKVDSMYSILTNEKSAEKLVEQALENMVALIKDEGKTAAEEIWSHPSSSKLLDLTKNSKNSVVGLALATLNNIIKVLPDLGLAILDKLTLKYIFGRLLSSSPDVSVDMCMFTSRLLENLTQIRTYQTARDAALENARRNKTHTSSFLPKDIYPPYKLDAKLEESVQTLVGQVVRATNSYRLEAGARDILLQSLTTFIPSETGIGWSKRFVTADGNLERLLEVAAATGPATVTDLSAATTATAGDSSNTSSALVPATGGGGVTRRPKPRLEEAEAGMLTTGLPEVFRGGVLKTSANTRLIVACLLARLFNDLRSDQDRQHFSNVCCQFVMELLTDKYIESKVEAAAVIGTLFSGPHEVGSRVLATEGILEGLLLLTQSENLAYQTVALDTIILATSKKDKCMAIVSQAVPILRSLYKSPDDGIKVRALLGLCKLGVLGGSDASVKSMADGSTVILMKACRRLLLKENKTLKLEDANTTRWAIDGLAYLSLNGDVKEALVKDDVLLKAVYKVAESGYQDAAFPLVSLLANLTNSFPEKEVTPEMLEIAKFAKQHIPEKHEADEAKPVQDRRKAMIDAGLPSCLYNLTMKLVTKTSAAQPQVRELVSRAYLACAEIVDKRGALVAAGAGKTLLNLFAEDNTEEGKYVASQALAKLTITADPRITFPGERSLEVIRPLLRLLDMECSALQNFEALLALTNLASLGDKHRCRMLKEGALPKIEHYMFEEHEDLRRAAVECFGNLAQHPAVPRAYSGVAEKGDKDGKEEEGEERVTVVCGASGSEVVKLLVLYCYEEKDVFLVRAASGALATMSHNAGVRRKIIQVGKWKEKLEALTAHPSPAIQYRAAFLLRSLVEDSEALARDIAAEDSRLVELLDYLYRLPDIDDKAPLSPETIVLGQGRPKDMMRAEAKSDRKRTREQATAAIKKLIDYGLIKPTEAAKLPK